MLKRFERFPTADVEMRTLFGGTVRNFVRGGRLNQSGTFGEKLVHGVAQAWHAAQKQIYSTGASSLGISDDPPRGTYSFGRISNGPRQHSRRRYVPPVVQKSEITMTDPDSRYRKRRRGHQVGWRRLIVIWRVDSLFCERLQQITRQRVGGDSFISDLSETATSRSQHDTLHCFQLRGGFG